MLSVARRSDISEEQLGSFLRKGNRAVFCRDKSVRVSGIYLKRNAKLVFHESCQITREKKTTAKWISQFTVQRVTGHKDSKSKGSMFLCSWGSSTNGRMRWVRNAWSLSLSSIHPAQKSFALLGGAVESLHHLPSSLSVPNRVARSGSEIPRVISDTDKRREH